MSRPIKAVIDLAALAHNLGVARRAAPGARVFAVIKANAYGHGVMRAARALDAADGVALLELDAAVYLREQGYAKRMALLEGLFAVDELATAAAHDLTITIHDQEQLNMLDAAPAGARFDVMLKINTGMNRLGFAPREARAACERLQQHRAVKQLTLMTHFATADDARGVAWQMEQFEQVAAGHWHWSARSPIRRRSCATRQPTPTGCVRASCSTAAARLPTPRRTNSVSSRS